MNTPQEGKCSLSLETSAGSPLTSQISLKPLACCTRLLPCSLWYWPHLLPTAPPTHFTTSYTHFLKNELNTYAFSIYLNYFKLCIILLVKEGGSIKQNVLPATTQLVRGRAVILKPPCFIFLDSPLTPCAFLSSTHPCTEHLLTLYCQLCLPYVPFQDRPEAELWLHLCTHGPQPTFTRGRVQHCIYTCLPLATWLLEGGGPIFNHQN